MRVAVSFDSERGYYTTAPDVPTVTALSLAGVRKRIAAALMPMRSTSSLSWTEPPDVSATAAVHRRWRSPAGTPGRETSLHK